MKQIEKFDKPLNKVLIMGMTFKAESDDIRNSLSFKMKKIVESKGIMVKWVDPFIRTTKYNDLHEYDAVIFMTPHKYFTKNEDEFLKAFRTDCIIADVWKCLKYTNSLTNAPSGIYEKGIY